MNTEAGRCEVCGGRLDRPGLFRHSEGHPPPTKAQKIVWLIEDELNGRRGLGWSGLALLNNPGVMKNP